MQLNNSEIKENYRRRLRVLESQMYGAQRHERMTLLAILSLLLTSGLALWHLWHIGLAVSFIILGVSIVSAILLRRLRSFQGDAIADARLCTWYEHGVARLEGEWQGQGSNGEEFARESHPYQSISVSSVPAPYSSYSRPHDRSREPSV